VILGVFRKNPPKEYTPMALDESALPELLAALRAGDGVDLIRDAVRLVMQELIELEATDVIGAGRYERSDTRTNERNGHRPRMLATQAGDIELKIPKLSHGSFFPALLEPRRRIDKALHAVIMQAYVEGVSTRSVDDLVQALGIDSGISKSQVSRICARLDEQVDAFRNRSLAHVEFPYVYLDATYVKARDTDLHQVVSRAVMIATGITAGGDRLSILKLCEGSYYPGWLLEPRRRAERALVAVVAECYVRGVSTRRVEGLVQSLGIESLSKSQVSRMAAELDVEGRRSATGRWMVVPTRTRRWTP
jgi:transposase-like protein